jgi:hypothetical protein
MKRIVAIGVLGSLLGCATLSDNGKSVKIADPAQLSELKTCKEIGKVVESSEYGRSQLVINLKNKTAEIGGNVLVSKLQTEKTMGVLNAADVTQGKAFDCPQEVLAKLQSAEDF